MTTAVLKPGAVGLPICAVIGVIAECHALPTTAITVVCEHGHRSTRKVCHYHGQHPEEATELGYCVVPCQTQHLDFWSRLYLVAEEVAR